MLPPGHLAAGVIAADVLLNLGPYSFAPVETRNLMLIGALIGFLPDLDSFASFFKQKKLRINNEVANHREYISHAPLLWLVAGLIVFFLAESEFNRTVGLMIWLSSWSHFILDSEWGIRWLWPFSGKWFPFSDRFYEKIYSEPRLEDSNTFRYWFKLALNEYKKPQGFLEILIVITGIIVFFK